MSQQILLASDSNLQGFEKTPSVKNGMSSDGKLLPRKIIRL